MPVDVRIYVHRQEAMGGMWWLFSEIARMKMNQDTCVIRMLQGPNFLNYIETLLNLLHTSRLWLHQIHTNDVANENMSTALSKF